jgi:teichuronic acid biosynthesis glycosyltransferase TuaC
MRVLFLVDGYPSPDSPAKCIFHKTQADALQRLGVDVDVVAPVPAVPPGLDLLKPRWRNYRSIPYRYNLGEVRVYRPRYVHWPMRLHFGPGAGNAFGRATIRALSTKPDLVHAHFAYPPGLAASWLARRLRVPTVLTLHGSDVNVVPGVNERMAARFSKACASADAVIAVSQALAERTEQLTRRRPAVIPIGIALKNFQNSRSKKCVRQTLGLPARTFLLGYVGHLSRGKGLLELLEGLKRLSSDGIEGLIVGDGPLRSIVERARGVRYFSRQPNERISVFMAACDALILPSYSEGLPTVLVEAGSVGVPVIGTTVGGIPELLGSGRGVLIPPHSVDALVDAVREVVRDPLGANERAARFHRHVAEHYDADVNATRLLEVYRSLC